MNSFEFNKIFAAVLVAAIVAMLGGFISKKLIHPHDLETDAVSIEGGPVASAGPAAAAMPEPILHLIATADVAQGEKLSKACAACHAFEKGGPNKVGPGLWGVVNAQKGHHAGFAYSEALIAKGGAWSYDSLNKFLWKPKAYIDGTKMSYIGMKKPEDRAAIIAWLRTLADSPAGFPGDADIAKEKAELTPPPAEVPPEAPAVETAAPAAAETPAPAAAP